MAKRYAGFLPWFLAIVVFVLAGCRQKSVHHNSPPTVVITSGPTGVIASDSANFGWIGEDIDGNLVGFYYGLDDSSTGIRTEDTAVTVHCLSLGEHEFYIRAVDDSGKRSNAAVRSFRVQFDSSVAPRGTDTTLEIITWNIQNFPKQGDSTVNRVRALMARLDADIYAVQEIEDTLAFRELLSGLSGYTGFYSRDDYGSFYQKTGVVYKSGIVTVTDMHQLFWGNDSVPRPPMEMTMTANHNGGTFDFHLIVLHLKAGGSAQEQSKRKTACRLLKEHLDEELEQGEELDFLVVGDWNDKLDDPPDSNVFTLFLEDTLQYRFLTFPLAGNSYYGSYIGGGGYGSLIDHILATRDALNEYDGGITMTLRLDDETDRYGQLISDHRPVMAIFPVFRK